MDILQEFKQIQPCESVNLVPPQRNQPIHEPTSIIRKMELVPLLIVYGFQYIYAFYKLREQRISANICIEKVVKGTLIMRNSQENWVSMDYIGLCKYILIAHQE